ncbi:MAG: prolipoprotein diacylglyceryl transferase [Ruminococcaceae bacterium]|nr:prolipoprotein diacylglyceryl transferase [Oscillospiraceae bacterium]
MNTINLFGIEFHINPVAFSLFGWWDVYWYGIIITVGVLSAFLYGMKNAKRFDMNPDHIFNSFVVVLPISILSARAYYIIFDPNMTFADFFDISGRGFAGLAIYGGVIGAAITIFIMQRIYKFNILSALDITSLGFLIGQGIGRWGNFVNQEAYGTFTGSDWFGMTGSKIASQMQSNDLVHPCFLYESLWCILGFILLHFASKKRKYKGQVALMYGAWYGFERTFIELLRIDSLMLGNSGIRVSSLLSALLCITCVAILIIMHKKSATKENDKTYVPVFADGEEGTEENTKETFKDVEIDLSEDTTEHNISGGNENEDN